MANRKLLDHVREAAAGGVACNRRQLNQYTLEIDPNPRIGHLGRSGGLAFRRLGETMKSIEKIREIELLGIGLLPFHMVGDVLVFAEDEVHLFGVQGEQGPVLAFEKGDSGKSRIMNSSFDQYLQMQDEILDYFAQVVEMSDEEAEAFVQAKREAFSRIDAAALNRPESWWSLVLEQMEAGMI